MTVHRIMSHYNPNPQNFISFTDLNNNDYCINMSNVLHMFSDKNDENYTTFTFVNNAITVVKLSISEIKKISDTYSSKFTV